MQKAAAAVFTPEGLKACREHIAVYRENTRIMAETLKRLGIWFVGGKNSPYIWLKCPGGMDSWSFFDDLLRRAHVVGTPGAGFGKNGEGSFRLTAFGDAADTREAMQRIERVY